MPLELDATERAGRQRELHLHAERPRCNARHPVRNTLVLKRAYSYAANCDLTVFIEPDDDYLSNNGNAHEGAVATRLGLGGTRGAQPG